MVAEYHTSDGLLKRTDECRDNQLSIPIIGNQILERPNGSKCTEDSKTAFKPSKELNEV
jgi:hypothetical protein